MSFSRFGGLRTHTSNVGGLFMSQSEREVPARRDDLDWLRVIAVILLIIFHTARIFDAPPWYVKQIPPSNWADMLVGFMNWWHMPLFFLISGAGTWFALNYRSGTEYLRERTRRLFIPFLFGTLVIVPPQIYYRGISQAGETLSYIEFYPRYFIGVVPQGNLEWAHLWFLAYLLTFSLIMLPVFLFLKSERGSSRLFKLTNWFEARYSLLWLGLPLALFQVLLRAGWPGSLDLINDWANFFNYLTYFAYGFLLSSNPVFKRMINRDGPVFIILALLGALVFLILAVTGLLPAFGYTPAFMLSMVLNGFNSWFWVLSILYIGQRYLNRRSEVLNYANRAAFPFYVLHQTVIVVLAYYIIKWPVIIPVQFAAICAVSFIGTLLIYDLVVKRMGITRFLFGMK